MKDRELARALMGAMSAIALMEGKVLGSDSVTVGDLYGVETARIRQSLFHFAAKQMSNTDIEDIQNHVHKMMSELFDRYPTRGKTALAVIAIFEGYMAAIVEEEQAEQKTIQKQAKEN